MILLMFCELQGTTLMKLAQELIGIGVLATIGMTIIMTIVIGTNSTGWNAGVTNLVVTIIPLVLAAGFVLGVIGLAMQRKSSGV
jgi:hypothetical protein